MCVCVLEYVCLFRCVCVCVCACVSAYVCEIQTTVCCCPRCCCTYVSDGMGTNGIVCTRARVRVEGTQCTENLNISKKQSKFLKIIPTCFPKLPKMVPKASKIILKAFRIWRKTDCSHQSGSNGKITQKVERDSVTFGHILASKIDEMNNKNQCQEKHVFQSNFFMVWTSFLRCFFKIFWEKINSISEKVKNRKTLQNTGHASKN